MLYGRNLNAPLFKSALPEGITVTFSKAQGVFISLDCTLRPQLTFSFPTNMMSSVFREVLHKEYATNISPRIGRMSEFLSELDAEIQTKEQYIQEDSKTMPLMTNVKRKEKEKLEADRKAAQDFWASERDKIEQLFHDIRNLSGLSLLVTEYILDLFILNQQDPHVNEPGPKPFLKIVSRLSFSEMFTELTDAEKKEFIAFFDAFPQELGARLVKPYRKDAPDSGYEQSAAKKGAVATDEERISLHQWLKSISTPVNRIQSPTETPVMRDWLSPPKYTARVYSMGAVSTSAVPLSHAIIEARGYCDVKIDSVHYPTLNKVSIDNISRLINDEARKFFVLDKGESK